MNIALWIVQAILAIKLITTAVSHAFPQSKVEMRQAVEKMGTGSRLWHGLVAVLTLVSAVGLILPGLFGVQTQLVLWAAVLTGVLMLASIFFHVRYRDKPIIIADIVLFILAAFVAYGRYALAPF